MTASFLPSNSGSNSDDEDDEDDDDDDDDNNNNNNFPLRCLIMNPRVIKVVQVDELCQVWALW